MEQYGLRETSCYLAQDRGLGIHLLLMQNLWGKIKIFLILTTDKTCKNWYVLYQVTFLSLHKISFVRH